jgi:hypothetical protein
LSKKTFVIALTVITLVFVILLFQPSGSEKESDEGSLITADNAKQNNSSNSANPRNDKNTREHSSDSNKRRINVNRHHVNKNALTLTQVDEIGQQFKFEKNPELRKELFDRLISGMTMDNILKMRKYIAHLPADSKEFMDFHIAYGALAKDEAIINGAQTPKPDMALSLQGWAASDPQSAMEWFNELDLNRSKGKFTSQSHLVEGMLKGLINTNPTLATEFLAKFPGHDSSMKSLSYILADNIWKEAQKNDDIDSAKSWATELPQGKMRTYAQAVIAQQLAQRDPQAAAEWISEAVKGSENADYAFQKVTEAWAKKDAAAAVNWLESTNNQRDLKVSYFHAFSAWASKDQNAAREYLDQMPDSTNRNQAVSGYSIKIAAKNPDSALKLASSITESGTRTNALIATSQIAFQKNTKGLIKWLPKSNLPKDIQRYILKSHYNKRKRKR